MQRPKPLECRLFLSDQSGAAAVEFAAVLPAYLVVCLGILAYGIYFGACHSVQQLAADAARYSIAGLNNHERIALSTAYVRSNASSYPLLDPARVSVSSQPSGQDGSNLTVRVTYDAKDLPIWRLVKFVTLPTPLIARVAVIHRGGEL